MLGFRHGYSLEMTLSHDRRSTNLEAITLNQGMTSCSLQKHLWKDLPGSNATMLSAQPVFLALNPGLGSLDLALLFASEKI